MIIKVLEQILHVLLVFDHQVHISSLALDRDALPRIERNLPLDRFQMVRHVYKIQLLPECPKS